jgi:hypothetical protein
MTAQRGAAAPMQAWVRLRRGRSRGRLTTKIHALVERHSVPLPLVRGARLVQDAQGAATWGLTNLFVVTQRFPSA